MNVHCPHCRHEQELPESLINKVVDCPSCRRRFVARRSVAQRDSRYFWMPLEIGGGKLRLPKPRPSSLDLKTGEVSSH